LPVSAVALCAAAGVLTVAAAYTAGRLGHAGALWAQGVYWAGQALIVLPAAGRLLARDQGRGGTRQTAAIAVIFTVAEYLVKVCYSPASFTFVDELEHWRSTVDVLQTGRLLTPNQLLPVSPHYPGLEEVTAALCSVTRLPVFVSGLIVAGTAHLLFACALYLLFQRVGRSHRLAGAATLLYSGNSHFTYIDSIFGYQTLALGFFGLALLATWHLTSLRASGKQAGTKRAGWLAVAVLAIFGTVVTHHITSYALVLTLFFVSLAMLVTQGRRAAGPPTALALVAAAAAAAWLALAAPKTVPYLQSVPLSVLHGVIRFLLGGATSAPPAGGPLGGQLLSAGATVVMAALLPAGWWHVWRHHRSDPWTVAMAAGSVSWFALIPVRLLVAYGSELAGRGATFASIPAAYVAALALAHHARALRTPGLRRAAAAAPLLAACVLVFNGLANGWPPYWERLPGPHQVAAFERSVGPEEIAAARWALASLGPGRGFAADWGNYQVLGSYGDQDMATGIGYLYTSPSLGWRDAWRALDHGVRYVVADRRLSQQVPEQGPYFPGGLPWASSHPLPAADLAKFAHTTGVDRRYDSGNIVIYDLWEWEHAL
jgi:hypothetical protein